jgi:hypothetical protein
MEMALNLRRRSAWAVPLIGAAVCWSMCSMRIGIDFQESDTLPWLQAARLDLGADLEAEVARLHINTAPYQSGDTQLLAVTLERAVATPIASDLQQRL